MIILPELKMVVVGPPKCATTMLHYELVRPPWNGFQLDPDAQHDFDVPGQYAQFTRVSPVRDPYDRATSLYWHYLRDVRRERCLSRGMTGRQEWARLPLPTEEISFLAYMEMLMVGTVLHLARPNFHFFTNTVSDWLDRLDYLDKTIRVEHLADDWAALVGAGFGDVKFGIRNSPGRGSWATYKSAKAIAAVDAWAYEDFERYGYDRQTCADC